MDNSSLTTCGFSWDGSRLEMTWRLGSRIIWSLLTYSHIWWLILFLPWSPRPNTCRCPIRVAAWIPHSVVAWLKVNILRAQREIYSILMTLSQSHIESLLPSSLNSCKDQTWIMSGKVITSVNYSVSFFCYFFMITLNNYWHYVEYLIHFKIWFPNLKMIIFSISLVIRLLMGRRKWGKISMNIIICYMMVSIFLV